MNDKFVKLMLIVIAGLLVLNYFKGQAASSIPFFESSAQASAPPFIKVGESYNFNFNGPGYGDVKVLQIDTSGWIKAQELDFNGNPRGQEFWINGSQITAVRQYIKPTANSNSNFNRPVTNANRLSNFNR